MAKHWTTFLPGEPIALPGIFQELRRKEITDLHSRIRAATNEYFKDEQLIKQIVANHHSEETIQSAKDEAYKNFITP